MNQYLLIDDDDIFNFLHSEVIKQVDASAEIISHSSSIEALDYLKELIHDKIQLAEPIFYKIYAKICFVGLTPGFESESESKILFKNKCNEGRHSVNAAMKTALLQTHFHQD